MNALQIFQAFVDFKDGYIGDVIRRCGGNRLEIVPDETGSGFTTVPQALTSPIQDKIPYMLIDGQKFIFYLADKVGGYEGEGEYVSRVVAVFTEQNECVGYVQVLGFYTSDNGTEWDTDFVEVEPYVKRVIDWK